jgi:hypothetical protein
MWLDIALGVNDTSGTLLSYQMLSNLTLRYTSIAQGSVRGCLLLVEQSGYIMPYRAEI